MKFEACRIEEKVRNRKSSSSFLDKEHFIPEHDKIFCVRLGLDVCLVKNLKKTSNETSYDFLLNKLFMSFKYSQKFSRSAEMIMLDDHYIKNIACFSLIIKDRLVF